MENMQCSIVKAFLLYISYCQYNFRIIKVFIFFKGPDYIKQKFSSEPMEIKEVIEEKKEKTPSGSPHFYRKGTTPTQTPTHSPGPTPPPSPPPSKKKSFFNRSTPKSTKESIVESLASSVIPKTAPRLPAKQEVKQEAVSSSLAPYKPMAPVANSSSPGNGEVHSQYHSYYVKAEVSIPPEEEKEEEKHESLTALTRASPPVKQYRAPTPSMPPAKLATTRDVKPELKLKKQDSLKPKSLSETKKASMEITTDVVEEESVSDLHTHLVNQKIWQRFIWFG